MISSISTSWKRAAEQNCLALLELCNSLPKLSQIHTHILKIGLHSNPFVLTRFASRASDLNAIQYASGFLFGPDAQTHLYDTFLFNTVIRAYAQTSHSKKNAVFYYKMMIKDCILPNKFTYPFVLKACAGIGDLGLGQSVYASVLKYGFGDDKHVLNTMVHIKGNVKKSGMIYMKQDLNNLSSYEGSQSKSSPCFSSIFSVPGPLQELLIDKYRKQIFGSSFNSWYGVVEQ
ncbi:OLC1v1032876C1 [Oldenlandia corymbosa var. corymbosa]|uniref:OLC1v1032876C1 n=1 Tax=Oldenlandia corymbosa var. corymbosa TaxID=529605 RepID=A0AAV1CNG6_OLDCO|nr:OLC1v1032876C1 [Oldenlandia corymbosa var. corymbosa]